MLVLHRTVELAGFIGNRGLTHGTGTRSFSSSNQFKTMLMVSYSEAREVPDNMTNPSPAESMSYDEALPESLNAKAEIRFCGVPRRKLGLV